MPSVVAVVPLSSSRRLFFALVLLAFTLSPAWAGEKLVIAGSGDLQGLLRDLAGAFEKGHPGYRVEVPESIGSSGGIRATAEGASDLGRVARPLSAKEMRFGLNYRLIAYSPVVFLAHPESREVENLSLEQVVGVFSGALRDWQDLGGSAGPIYVVNREAGDSSRIVLEEKVPGFADIETFAGKVLFTTPDALKVLARYPGTLGYSSLSQVTGSTLAILTIDGVAPTLDNVRSGRYPLRSPLGLVWKFPASAKVSAFLTFLDSPQARQIIMEHGAVPVEASGR